MRTIVRLFLAGACLAGLVTAFSDAALADKRIALVIGNSAYQNVPALPNPARDVAAMAKTFRGIGYEVTELRDLAGPEFRKAIRDFTLQARDADIAVVYFAGHGIEVGGINYLIPVDAKLAADIEAEDEGVSLDRVVRAIEPARRLRLVILDACRDNPFSRKMQRTIAVRTVSAGLAKVELTLSDTMIAYAARAGSTAEDGSGGNSPYTAALIKHIPEPGVDVRIAFGRVRDEVWSTTGHRQEPFVYGSIGGAELPLVPAAAAPAMAPAEPAPVAAVSKPVADPPGDTTVRRHRDSKSAALDASHGEYSGGRHRVRSINGSRERHEPRAHGRRHEGRLVTTVRGVVAKTKAAVHRVGNRVIAVARRWSR